MIQMVCARYLADWLTVDVGAGVTRVNDALHAVPLLPGDTVPPDIVIVAHPYTPLNNDSLKVAQDVEPRAFPALYVTAIGPALSDGELAMGDGSVADFVCLLALRYIVRASDLAAGEQWAAYSMKALMRCLVSFFANDAVAEAARGAGNPSGVVMLHCGDGLARHELTMTTTKHPGVTYGPWSEKIGNAVANQIMSVMVYGRDLAP